MVVCMSVVICIICIFYDELFTVMLGSNGPDTVLSRMFKTREYSLYVCD